MFEAEFHYTDKIVNNIAKIASANETIRNSKIISLYANKLKQDALINSSHHSTSIEGNLLTLNEVKTVITNNKATNKAEQEVLNYFNVLNHLDKYFDKQITKKTILSLHSDLSKGLLRNSRDEGKFRDAQVVVANQVTKKINYVPPSYFKVNALIDDLLEWLNTSANEMYPVVLAGIFHYEFVCIHPFLDVNGRMARIITTLILSQYFDNYFSFDEYYNQDRQAYFDALSSADKTQNLTNWLEYFTSGVLYSIDKVKEEVLNLAEITSKYISSINLTPNEISVLMLLEEKKHIQNKDVQKMLNISPQASYKIICKLKDKELIKSVGKGRNTGYVLK